ncbi:MAG: PAS domain S-box protein [Arcobacteraceae bacterium]
MKRSFFVSLFFLIIIGMLIYNTNNANKKIENFFNLHKKIFNMINLNKNFDIFISSSKNYNNYDIVQNYIKSMHNEMEFITTNSLFQEVNNRLLKENFSSIQEEVNKKILLINKIISRSAILNNSYRYVQKLSQESQNAAILEIYSNLLELDLNSEMSINKVTSKIESFTAKTSNEELFIVHAQIVLSYHEAFHTIRTQSKELVLNEKLNEFESNFTQYSHQIMNDLKSIIWFLMLALFGALLTFLYYMHQMTMKQIELNRFKKAVQSSDNIVVITDKNHIITYVNKEFERITGFKDSEVLGKKPSILKSDLQSKAFYEELNQTIHQGKKWQGEFINKNKYGELSYEKASITPILNEQGEIEEFLAIKLDITKEKETLKLLQEKDHILSQQAKMIAMREMLESIAHQWRQPLSTISTAASGMKLEKEFNNLDDKKFDELMDVIVQNTLNLSSTLDNFKNYFNTKNEKTVFSLDKTIKKVLDLVGYRLNDEKIEVILSIEELPLEGLENELMQSLVNIINNSQEAFRKNELSKRYIFIESGVKDNKAIITIKDNANGISEDVLEHVFEPYFTTKHQSSGTGIGLYMVYEIITKHFNGSITMENCEFVYDNQTYKGAKTIIEVPLKR